jgi:hypothetical protein
VPVRLFYVVETQGRGIFQDILFAFPEKKCSKLLERIEKVSIFAPAFLMEQPVFGLILGGAIFTEAIFEKFPYTFFFRQSSSCITFFVVRRPVIFF